MRVRRKHGGDSGDSMLQIEFFLINVQLPGFDFREIENIAQQFHERVRRRFRHCQIFFLLAGEVCIQQQLENAGDAVHGNANIVAHRRQKRAFRSIRHFRFTRFLFGLAAGVFQRAIRFPDLPLQPMPLRIIMHHHDRKAFREAFRICQKGGNRADLNRKIALQL